MRILFPVAATLVLLAGCVAQAPKTPPPAPAPTAAPTPVAAPAPADWRDVPQTPGVWTYRRDARGSIALFGITGADAVLTLRCDLTARQVFLSRSGISSSPLTIRTTSTTRALAVRPTGGTPPYAAVALVPSDPILDAMAFSRGRFVIEQSGAATLAIPAWAEVGRVTEDCRG